MDCWTFCSQHMIYIYTCAPSSQARLWLFLPLLPRLVGKLFTFLASTSLHVYVLRVPVWALVCSHRTTRVPKLPDSLFMIMRVITLLRGVLASMGVLDVSSALLWKPLADKVCAYGGVE